MQLNLAEEVVQQVLDRFTKYIADNPVSNGQRAERNYVAMETALYEVAAQQRRDTVEFIVTERQLLILKMLSEGKTYKQIALELGISSSTVRTHLHQLYKTFGVHDRAQAAHYYLQGRVSTGS